MLGNTNSQRYTSLSIGSETKSRDDLCREYFHAGYTNSEICALLEMRHRIVLSPRHLRRLLTGMGLRRRNNTDIEMTVSAIKNEIHGSGCTLGYRALQRRLLTSYGIVAPRDLVAQIQRLVDPEAVEAKRNHRLKRRRYWNSGPNYLIHIDGYDKLKRFGFAIDGFSRRILWLRVGQSNNKPELVASNFMDYLEEIKGVPRCIRIDAGTENTLIIDIQTAFRQQQTDDMSDRSVIVGSSPRNQRIERYWRTSRESGCQFWIDYMRDMESSGQLDVANPIHLQCIRFSFMEILQADLDTQRTNWNQHCIRQSTFVETLGGKPDILFFTPNLYGCQDYKTEVSSDVIQEVRQTFCEEYSSTGCEQQFIAHVQHLMRDFGKAKPTSHDEALSLFTWLVRQF